MSMRQVIPRAVPALLGLIGLGALALLLPARAEPAEQPAAPAQVERYAGPFPGRWVERIFDKQVAQRMRETRFPRAEALDPGDLELSVTLWPGPEIVAGEPLLARLAIANPSNQAIRLPFIGSVGEAIHFAIINADGQAVGRAYQPPPTRGDGSVEVFPAETTKTYETVVSHWYDFAEPGRYGVEAKLIVVRGLSRERERVVLSSQAMAVTVRPRDVAYLEERCAQLALGQQSRLWPLPLSEPAANAPYRPSAEASMRALLHVTDEAVLPNLWLLTQRFDEYTKPVTAISYVDTPKAVAVLRRLAAHGPPKLQQQAEIELERLGVGPESPPPPSPAPPATSTETLVQELARRPGLALVAEPEVARAETAVHGDPAGPIADLAAAFEAAGFRAYFSVGAQALVLLSPPAEVRDPLAERFATASRLLETVTPEQLARREKGYIRSRHLTAEQIELLYELLHAKPGSAARKRSPVSKLALGIWRMSGADIVLRAGGESVVAYAGPRRAPLRELTPNALDASALWWHWPYCLSPFRSEPQVSVGPVAASLREVLALLPADPLPQDLGAGADKVLLVSAREAPRRHLMWALEIATGLPAIAPRDAASKWAFAADRYPGRADRTDSLLRLPALGFRSPDQTPAGASLLAGSAAESGGSGAPAWKADDLPPAVRRLVLQWLPTPRFLSLPAETDYEALAAQGDIVVLWPRGIHMEASVLEADGSGGGYDFNLPAF